MAIKCARCLKKLHDPDEQVVLFTVRQIPNRALPIVVCPPCALRHAQDYAEAEAVLDSSPSGSLITARRKLKLTRPIIPAPSTPDDAA